MAAGSSRLIVVAFLLMLVAAALLPQGAKARQLRELHVHSRILELVNNVLGSLLGGSGQQPSNQP